MPFYCLLGMFPFFNAVSRLINFTMHMLSVGQLLPVIGSINSEVEQFSLGVTAPPDDPRALAEAIKRLINTPFKDRQGMAKRATELAQSTYSRQRIISQYDLFLRGLVSS